MDITLKGFLELPILNGNLMDKRTDKLVLKS